MLQFLFETVSDLNSAESIVKAYILAFFTGFLWLIGAVTKHTAFYEIPIFIGRARGSLIVLIFKKLTKISQYTAKSQELGKIINMISNDFNLIELKGAPSFAGMVVPFHLIGVLIILIFRFGWLGIVPPLFIIIMAPLQLCIGKINGNILRKVNIHKDQRIKICT